MLQTFRPSTQTPCMRSSRSPFDTKGCQCLDEPTLDDVDDVGHGSLTLSLAPLHDGVAHHLAGTVPGQTAASVNGDGRVVGRGTYSVVAGAGSDGDHFGVRQDEQGVGDGSFDALVLQFFHERLRFLVGYFTEDAHVQHVVTPSELARRAKAAFAPVGLVQSFHGGLFEGHEGDGGEQELGHALTGCHGERITLADPRGEHLEFTSVV